MHKQIPRVQRCLFGAWPDQPAPEEEPEGGARLPGVQRPRRPGNDANDSGCPAHAEWTGRRKQAPEEHHDHLIDINTGEIIEFVNDDIEKLQKKVAEKLGYKLVDHRLELYGSKNKK